MLKIAGLVLLVALILIGALLPLKYTARMHLPRPPADRAGRDAPDAPPGGKSRGAD
jgi:hypothetical protein